MIQVLFVCLLILYYWYFYTSSLNPIEKPVSSSPSTPEPYNVKFDSKQPNHFQFTVNGNLVWEHTLPADTFTFNNDKIVARDPCHGLPDGMLIPAKGEVLYEYVKKNPELNNHLKFNENSQFTVHKGDVFYFKCLKGRIDKLDMCPSGKILIGGVCETINSCTHQPNGTKLPHPYVTQYITCQDGKETIKKCPKDQIFYHNRCEDKKSLNHYCKYFPDRYLVLDDVTRMECQNGKPVFITCKPGTKLFDKNYCEPALCNGVPDGTKLPLPSQTMNPFNFIPGYITCKGDKIHETIKCPQHWDEMLSNGDNLTFLPMVFDGEKCTIPTFCDNVFAVDPDIIVPVHEYTKYVKNWNLSKILDHGEGYICENNTRKRKCCSVDSLISKRFKLENACEPHMPTRLPIFDDPLCYYDCNSKSLKHCPKSTYFNGVDCVPQTENVFTFRNFPIFKFDSLNSESWIRAWDYSKRPAPTCQNPESIYNSIYNICSHPDCSKYEFLSQIPDMAILLPREHRAKCKFYENERLLKKEPVNFNYHFWTQKIVNSNEQETCTPGRKIQSGNFIWDSTIYITCDMNQPFVFCPSKHTERIIQIDSYYVCEPPKSTQFIHNDVDWHLFEVNEIKRILPIDPNDTAPNVQFRKNMKPVDVPNLGLEVPEEEKFNLLANKPVILEPRYRVTHPPNVAFDYEDPKNVAIKTSTLNHAFLCKRKNFTDKPLDFPKYTPIPLVNSLNSFLYT